MSSRYGSAAVAPIMMQIPVDFYRRQLAALRVFTIGYVCLR
jgi:hypothetical protein